MLGRERAYGADGRRVHCEAEREHERRQHAVTLARQNVIVMPTVEPGGPVGITRPCSPYEYSMRRPRTRPMTPPTRPPTPPKNSPPNIAFSLAENVKMHQPSGGHSSSPSA